MTKCRFTEAAPFFCMEHGNGYGADGKLSILTAGSATAASASGAPNGSTTATASAGAADESTTSWKTLTVKLLGAIGAVAVLGAGLLKIPQVRDWIARLFGG